MNAIAPGVSEWTPQEQREKDLSLANPPRPFVSLVQNQIAGEYQLVPELFKNANERFVYSTATVNSILAWFNFPPKLRQFFDCLLVLSDLDAKPFTATNLDIGKQMSVGKGAKDDSLQKRISRYKAKMLEWQNQLGFDLIGIERGRFDALKQKNEPTKYTPFILEWIPEILNSVNVREWNKGHLFRLREIRRRTKNYLLSKPECPPLRGYEPKTMSEGQKFDREDKMLDAGLMRQLLRLHREGIDPAPYIKHRKLRENHIITNPTGAVGNVLTPEQDAISHLKSVWHLMHTGEIVDELESSEQKLVEKLERLESVDYDHLAYAVEIVKEEQRDIKTPRVWDKGEWQETANNFTSESVESPTGHFSKSASDNSKTAENRAANSFEINDHDRTFLNTTDGTFLEKEQQVSDDFTDWFNDAAETNQPPVINSEYLQALFEQWCLKIKELLPDKTPTELWQGAWQVYLDPTFETTAQTNARREMEAVREDILNGSKGMVQFRTAFCEWVAMGAAFYEKGASVPQSPQKLAQFAARLEKHLRIEDG